MNNALVIAAVSGILLGAASVAHAADAPSKNDVVKDGKHSCKGQNACKGQGGCKNSDKHSCKGQNACKGQGGCKG